MVTVSCSGKFHAFALAEQLERHQQLEALYTTYASSKNKLLKHFVKRIDKENISTNKIFTNTLIAFPIKLWQSNVHQWNDLFDRWVASRLRASDQGLFIGWSGMSLHSIRRARQLGLQTIVERGSSHILHQNNILTEEYEKFGIRFSIDPRVIEKELKEYEEADYISVPSTFAKRSFLNYGIHESKLFENAYGSSSFFKKADVPKNSKFTILYMGALTIQKGVLYLFQALSQLNIPIENFDVWFIGSIADEVKEIIENYKQVNWSFWGHINHYELPNYISKCDIAVQCSLQEGLSMVIPQIMACGIPVIATTNTGGENIITNGLNGYIIPIRSPEAIKEKVEYLFNYPKELNTMKEQAAAFIAKGFTWDDYGDRYIQFIKRLQKETQNKI